MKGKSHITLGIFQILIFVLICTAEILDQREIGLSKGKVIEIEKNGVTCFGEEYQFDANVVLDFYSDFHIPISTKYLSNKLTKGESATFIYWGQKSEIESPLQSLNDPTVYISNVQIALFSLESWVARYYILFLLIKWGSVITGVILLVPNMFRKGKTN
jgi:hypothetical protein